MNKNIFNLLFVYFFLSSIANVVAAEIMAPFGLEWGQTQKQLNNKNIDLTDCSTIKKVTSCTTTNPTKSVSFGELYLLFIDEEKGLQKIKMLGKDIVSDVSGLEGKALYSKVKKSLIKKYDKAKEYEYIGLTVYKEYDEFYQCLKYDGCGSWYAFWEGESGGTIGLQLKGLSRGKGYLSLTYESKEWGTIIDSLQQREDKSDNDAL